MTIEDEMNLKHFSYMRIPIALFLLLVSSVSVSSQSMSQIQQDINSGNYSVAEHELKQGLVEHPNSARGYYDLAYVEYKLNNLGDARAAIAKCRSLDPTFSFAHNQSEVLQLVNQLQGSQQYQGQVTTSSVLPNQHSQSSSVGMVGFVLLIFLLIGVAFVVGIIALLFSFRRSGASSSYPASSMNGPMYNTVNPPIVQQGSSTTSFLEGLAVGGVGGALLDETLRPRTEYPQQVIEEERSVPADNPNIQFDSGSNDSWSDGSNSGSSSDTDNSSNNTGW